MALRVLAAGGSFLLIICGLLLDDANQSQWRQAILLDNVLQKRNPVAAQKTAAHLRQRFRQSQPALWRMVRDGSSSLALQSSGTRVFYF